MWMKYVHDFLTFNNCIIPLKNGREIEKEDGFRRLKVKPNLIMLISTIEGKIKSYNVDAYVFVFRLTSIQRMSG